MNTKDLLKVDDFIKYLDEKENIAITKRTLRYYTLNGIFPYPAKIGGNKAFYSLSQIPKLKTIFFLKEFGKSIKEIKALLGGETYITKEGFQKIEQAVINRVTEMLLKVITDLQAHDDSRQVQNLKTLLSMLDKIEHWDLRASSNTSYFFFIAEVVKQLKKCICIIPSSWHRDDFEKLLLDRRYFKMTTVGVANSSLELASSLRVTREINYRKDGNIKTAKEKIKSKLGELINTHIASLQTTLESLQSL